MISLLAALSECFGRYTVKSTSPQDINAIALNATTAILRAEKGGRDLQKDLNTIVGSTGWTENLAKAVLGGIVHALNESAPMGHAMKEAFEKATTEATGFVREHPVFCTVIALGILVLLTPWVLEALGFAELGPIEGSFAAWWQSTYAGEVPVGSLFSFFQRLGMVWH